MIPNGLTTCLSGYGTQETMERFSAAVTRHGMTIFARIDHTAAATKVGMQLRPTELVIFGNPQAGTRLMQASQTLGIDLPLKALVWEDEAGKTWLGYLDPAWLAKRHGAQAGMEGVVGAMTEGLAAVAQEATARAS